MKVKALAYLAICVTSLPVIADPTIINNYTGGAPQQNASTPPPGAYNNPPPQQPQTDPRVPPAGAYVTKNPDGSGNQIYTTGETKPYNVDNSNGTGGLGNSPVMPQIYPQMPQQGGGNEPGPRR